MRLPYGIYKAAQAEALRQRQERALNDAAGLSNNALSNLAMATDAIKDKYSMRKRRRGEIDINLSGPGSSGATVTQEMERGYYSGRGGLFDFIPKSIRSAGASILNTGAKAALHAAGGAALSAAPALLGIGGYSGRGGYNNLFIDQGRPSMSSYGTGDEQQGMIISHTEYLQDIYGAPSANFYTEGWQLNPALAENFPWIAQIAANYEEYEFIQLVFHYKSTVDATSSNNPSGSTGTIIMATNYNPAAENFQNKETMMQYHGANCGRLTEDHTHGVECDPEKNAGTAQKYTRTAPQQQGSDLKTYDLGRFQLAQVNIPQAFWEQQIGELWVTYTVRLIKPRIFTSLGNAIQENRWVSNGSEMNFSNNNGLLFGTNQLIMQQNSNSVTMFNGPVSGNTKQTDLVFTFADFLTGTYEIQLFVEGTAGMNSTQILTETLGGNVTPCNDMFAWGGGTLSDNPSYKFEDSTTTKFFAVRRFAISPVTAANTTTNNVTWKIAVGDTNTTYNITQAQAVVRQVNGNLRQSNKDPVPLYVNAVGVAQLPY